MIEISHLTKKYGNQYAVKDLTFNMEEGKIYGFLGPNGAGKSTTMNLLTGYLAATAGEVKICGYDILKQPEEAKSRIGYLPELPPLYPDMTVLEYLRFVAELKKVPKKEREGQIMEVMEAVKVTEVKSRLIKNLSKGYRQRVGLAQAMLGRPAVLILDEPTVGLDPKQMIEMRELIRGLKEKHTVILSSHILSEVSAVCDQILIINKGQLVVNGTPEELQRRMAGNGELQVTLRGSKEELERILTKAELPLTLIQPVNQSLEEIFLALTESGGEEEKITGAEEGKATGANEEAAQDTLAGGMAQDVTAGETLQQKSSTGDLAQAVPQEEEKAQEGEEQ